MKKLSFIAALALSLACQASLLATPTPTPPAELSLLTAVLAKFKSCRSDQGVQVSGDRYTFACYNSADTAYSVALTRYPSPAEAQAQFSAARGGQTETCFHGYPAYESTGGNPNNPYIVTEQAGWQTGAWVAAIGTSYDYGYFHYSATEFSEALYSAGVERGLFPKQDC